MFAFSLLALVPADQVVTASSSVKATTVCLHLRDTDEMRDSDGQQEVNCSYALLRYLDRISKER